MAFFDRVRSPFNFRIATYLTVNASLPRKAQRGRTLFLVFFLYAVTDTEIVQGTKEKNIEHAVDEAGGQCLSRRYIIPQQLIDKVVCRDDH
jgi:hypothetical protein